MYVKNAAGAGRVPKPSRQPSKMGELKARFGERVGDFLGIVG